MIKWLGGAAAAIAIAFGAAAVSGQWSDRATQGPVPTLEDAIPAAESMAAGADATTIDVDPSALAGGGADAEVAPVQDTPTLQAAVASDTDTANMQQASDERFVVKRILPIEGPIKYGEWHWDTEGVPAGPIVMTVDLDARVISVFRGGYEIGASAVLLGTDKHPTPLGTFPIRYKMRHNVSEKYNNAPMPYSMFLTTDGIALHGSDVQNGFASHGCIGMPDEFAAKVFGVAKKGDKVIITRGETMGMGDAII